MSFFIKSPAPRTCQETTFVNTFEELKIYMQKISNSWFALLIQALPTTPLLANPNLVRQSPEKSPNCEDSLTKILLLVSNGIFFYRKFKVSCFYLIWMFHLEFAFIINKRNTGTQFFLYFFINQLCLLRFLHHYIDNKIKNSYRSRFVQLDTPQNQATKCIQN